MPYSPKNFSETKNNNRAEGTIVESSQHYFRVALELEAPENLGGQTILCTLSGKMRLYRIKVMPGDKVKCEISPYDKTKGRIIFRTK